MKAKALAAALALSAVALIPLRSSASISPTVEYIGDSTMVGERPYLPANANIQAFPGLDINAAYQNLGAGIQANPPGVAVISLGLDDWEAGLAFLFNVEQFVELFPVSTKIIWVKPVIAATTAYVVFTTAIVNAKDNALDYIASLHPNMVVLDWSPLPSYFSGDGVHYTDQGYQVRADAMQAEVNKAGA